MTGISLGFASGRYHATPWARHVNEGTPEWPPSPWRFLRALVATWKRKIDDRLSQADVEPLLLALMAPPQFVLPPASTGHSRHYMPWFKKGPDDRTLVFDTFVALPREAQTIVLWPGVAFSPEERDRLELLLTHLSFLGRAEAWCIARLLTNAEAADAMPSVNCFPLNGDRPPLCREIVRVLCANRDTAFGNKETPKIERTIGRGKDKRTVYAPLYDPDWHLCIETLALHEKRWSDPPGSRWIPYARSRDCFKIEPVGNRRLSRHPQPFQVARFSLDSTVLPLVTETLPVAESARRMLMGIYGRKFSAFEGWKGRSSIFSGKDASGEPLQGHGHTYYLPTDEDNDGRLDHLTLVTTDGFGPDELKALDRLRELKTREREDSGHPLRVLLLGLGRLDDYQPAPLRSSRAWTSATPFVAPRHLKKNGTKRDPQELWRSPAAFLAAVLREELARLIDRRPELEGMSADSIEVQLLVDEDGVFRIGQRRLRPIQFKRYRRKRGDDGGSRPAGAFRLEFPKPVRGPICLGHASHFGLGLFVPASADRP